MKRKIPSSSRIEEPGPLEPIPIMISACLLGIHCRYDGGEGGASGIIRFASSANIIPFCPEQLGGLSTPRPPVRIVGGDGFDVLSGRALVIDAEGDDVTDSFKKGAKESMCLARLTGSRIAILKDRSPSCGIRTPYCEKPEGFGMGVTAALLDQSRMKIMEIDAAAPFPPPGFREMLRGAQGVRRKA